MFHCSPLPGVPDSSLFFLGRLDLPWLKKKRSLEEIYHLNNLDKSLANVTVHGIVTSVPPVKKGHTCNFFDGALTDGTSKVHLVGFNSGQQKTIKQFKEALQFHNRN